MALSGKQKHYLRGLAHNLTPVVQLGKDGISQGVVAAVDTALTDHELIKVKIGQNAMLERGDAGALLARETGAEVAQVLGNTVLLYRAHPDEPKIRLP